MPTPITFNAADIDQQTPPAAVSGPVSFSAADIEPDRAPDFKSGVVGNTSQLDLLDRFLQLAKGYREAVLPERLSDIVTGPIYAAQHPIDSAQLLGSAIAKSHVDTGKQAVADAKAAVGAESPIGALTELARLVRDAAGTVVPVAGPAIAGAGQTMETEPERGAGQMLGIVTGPKVMEAALRIPARLAPALRESSANDIREALNPTRHRTKVKTDRLIPEIQRRGITGDLEDLSERAARNVERRGKDIGRTLDAHADESVDITSLKQKVADMKAQTFRDVPQAEGLPARAIHNPRKFAQVEAVEELLNKYGDTMTVEEANAIKKTWDGVVSQAGGFDEKAGSGAFGVSLNDASEAAVKRPLAGILRRELAQAVPDVQAINRDYGFWSDLQDVVNATKNRKVGQKRSGLMQKTVANGGRVVGGATGYAAGGATAAAAGAYLGGEIADRLNQIFTSPKWKLTSAYVKNELADALASGDPTRIGTAVGRVSRVQATLNRRATDTPRITVPAAAQQQTTDEQRLADARQ